MIKQIIVPFNHMAITNKNGRMVDILAEGKHWLSSFTEVEVFDMSTVLAPKLGIDTALQNAQLLDMIHLYDIAEDEMAFLYRNKRFVQVLGPGKYAFWKQGLAQFEVEQHKIGVHISTKYDLAAILRSTAANGLFTTYNVSEYQIALITENGQFRQVLQPGTYVFWKKALHVQASIQHTTVAVASNDGLKSYLQLPELAAQIQVIEVAQNEIALLYADGHFVSVLTAGQFGYWKSAKQFEVVRASLNDLEIADNIDRNLIAQGLLERYIRSFVVEPFEQGILLINGQMDRLLAPGTYHFWKNSAQVAVQKTDMRQVSLDITGQEILTKDKAQLRINFMVQYRVADLQKALTANKDFEKQLYAQMQLVLREIVGQLTFDEFMEGKDGIAQKAAAQGRSKAAELGVTLLDFGVKDIILPGDVKEIMHQVLIAEKRAQANVITRREETASMRSLLNTAKLMEDNAMLLKLKEMEYMEKIAEKIHTISLSGGSQVVDQLRQLFVK